MNFLRNFMTGRYGPDQLNIALIVSALIVSLVSRFEKLSLLIFPAYLLLVFAFYRMLSRNVTRRQTENERFLRILGSVKNRFKYSKTHKYFKCPSCRNTLRVPRNKGKLQITCPKCGERFIKKS